MRNNVLLILLMCGLALIIVSCNPNVSDSSEPEPVEQTVPRDSLAITRHERKRVGTLSDRLDVIRITSQGHEYLITSHGGIIHMEHCLERDIGYRFGK